MVEGLRLRRSLRLQFQDLMLGLGFTQELKARRTLKPKPTPKADRALRQNNLYIPYSSRGTRRLGRNGRRLRQRKVLSKWLRGSVCASPTLLLGLIRMKLDMPTWRVRET